MVKGEGHTDGAVRQAFQGALRKELADFYKLLASLEAQTENAMPEPNSMGEAPTSYLTLRRLLVWLGEPLVRNLRFKGMLFVSCRTTMQCCLFFSQHQNLAES